MGDVPKQLQQGDVKDAVQKVLLAACVAALSWLCRRWMSRLNVCRKRWSPHFRKYHLKKSLIAVGNPGRGKSTLLNGIATKPLFKSGVSIGTGLTFKLDEDILPDGVRLLDTPGLDDIAKREEAAKQIYEGLRSEGLFKLLFVIVLDAGRMAPADLAVMET